MSAIVSRRPNIISFFLNLFLLSPLFFFYKYDPANIFTTSNNLPYTLYSIFILWKWLFLTTSKIFLKPAKDLLIFIFMLSIFLKPTTIFFNRFLNVKHAKSTTFDTVKIKHSQRVKFNTSVHITCGLFQLFSLRFVRVVSKQDYNWQTDWILVGSWKINC